MRGQKILIWLSLAAGLLLGLFGYVLGREDERLRPLPAHITQPEFILHESQWRHHWDKVTSHHVLGAAALDINRDGKDELFIGGGQGQNDVLLELKGDRLHNIIDGTNLSSKAATYGATTLDIDADGDTDLLVARKDGITLYLSQYTANPGAPFIARSFPVPIPDGVPFAVQPINLDADGDADLYVSSFVDRKHFRSANYNNPAHIRYNILLRNMGDLQFVDITDDITRGLQNTFTSATIDLDNNGCSDIVLAPNTGQVEILVNLCGSFRSMELPTGYGFFMGLAAGDMDSDGDIDLIFSNSGTSMPPWFFLRGDLRRDQEFNGRWLLLRNEGALRFEDITAQTQLHSMGFGWGLVMEDINFDGSLDLMAGQNYVNWPFHKWNKLPGKILLNDPEAQPSFFAFASPVSENKFYGQSPLLADVDGDGRTDIVWINTMGPVRVLLNRTPGRFLSVRLPPTIASLNARLRVWLTDGRVLTRQVITAQGLGVAHTPRQVFGLGKALGVSRIEVRWPDGGITQLRNPALNTPIDIPPPS